jgi:hypothetical protein
VVFNGEIDTAGTLQITAGTTRVGDPIGTNPDSMTGTSILGGTGTVVVSPGATMQLVAGVCAGRFKLNGNQDGCVYLTPAIRNNGTLTVASGTVFRDSPAPISSSGTLDLDSPNFGDASGSSIAGGCIVIGGCAVYTLTNTGLLSTNLRHRTHRSDP